MSQLGQGCVVRARLIGAIEAEQKKKGDSWTRNDRLIAVATHAQTHDKSQKLSDSSGSAAIGAAALIPTKSFTGGGVAACVVTERPRLAGGNERSLSLRHAQRLPNLIRANFLA
jgi:hypothetical protein